MKALALLLCLFSASALAQDVFWHPAASEVVIAGPSADGAQVCYDTPVAGTCSGPTCVEWVCHDVELGGGKTPVYVTLPAIGPVKVTARWAFAADSTGHLFPMSRWMP